MGNEKSCKLKLDVAGTAVGVSGSRGPAPLPLPYNSNTISMPSKAGSTPSGKSFTSVW